jgi:hypothetical protein
MRVYEGSPRQDYEEVLRSIGAYLDQRGVREILLAEAPDGFIVQGLVVSETSSAASDSMGRQAKDTLTFLDDDISRFMEEAIARRKAGAPQPDFAAAGYYERALRVIGRYIDQQKPRDVFFFEQDRAFVLRLLMGTQSGARHVLAEFTSEEIETMVEQGPSYRATPGRQQLTGSPSGPPSGKR